MTGFLKVGYTWYVITTFESCKLHKSVLFLPHMLSIAELQEIWDDPLPVFWHI